MKARFALVTVLMLVLIGMVALAEDKTTAEIIIGSDVNLTWPSGDLTFTGAANAGAEDWFESSHLTASVEGNCDYTMTVVVTQFTAGTYTLPTQLGGDAFEVDGVAINPLITGLTPVWRAAPDTWAFNLYFDGPPSVIYPNYYGHGGAEYSGEFFLKVERDGYNDHAGTYEATITVTVAVI